MIQALQLQGNPESESNVATSQPHTSIYRLRLEAYERQGSLTNIVFPYFQQTELSTGKAMAAQK